MISKLQSMNNKELSDLGYDKNAIDEIRNFDYIKTLSERASINDETLLLYGYTKEEIKELREYANSDGKLRKTISSSTLTISMYFTNIKEGKQATCNVKWEWSQLPLARFFDCFAAAWKTTNGKTINYVKSSYNKMIITYNKIDPRLETLVATSQFYNVTTDFLLENQLNNKE